MPAGSVRGMFGVGDVDPEARKEALEAPGPSWREFLYFELAKVWVALGFLILDGVIFVFWTEPWNFLGMVPTLGIAFYLEFLLYRYLWYQPDLEKEYLRKEFRPTWFRPARFGRWTPEAWRIRDGEDPFGEVRGGPDPREFL